MGPTGGSFYRSNMFWVYRSNFYLNEKIINFNVRGGKDSCKRRAAVNDGEINVEAYANDSQSHHTNNSQVAIGILKTARGSVPSARRTSKKLKAINSRNAKKNGELCDSRFVLKNAVIANMMRAADRRHHLREGRV